MRNFFAFFAPKTPKNMGTKRPCPKNPQFFRYAKKFNKKSVSKADSKTPKMPKTPFACALFFRNFFEKIPKFLVFEHPRIPVILSIFHLRAVLAGGACGFAPACAHFGHFMIAYSRRPARLRAVWRLRARTRVNS